ncbi:Renal dipeptidase [Virgibacillus profundi]|uniref:Renal dipeptidase n=1 Tax=Virgibacillus profundi TaxID=2024555 RepID=A0A2A2IK84_9BACI|nr:nucleotidyltransferase family protein [Virgibacillus profundi]PAV31525.1 Renal dipeptidase [Virgibacillus profundi]PXY55711.1 Renal dipeptidase [Virgibacillus profundi]
MKPFKLNISQIPIELKFILDLLKEDFQYESNRASYEEINWDTFIKLSLHHRLYPVIYLKLKQLKEGIVPSFVMNYLSIQYKRNTLKMLKFSAITEQISRLLTDNQIPVILLKGPALAHQLYGDISHRTSGDLDFLVPIEKLEETEKLLVGQGYVKDEYIQTVLNDWKWRHHHFTYIHPQQNIKVEIHWRLNPGPGKEPKFNELWKRKSRSKLTHFPVYLLGKEDLLLFLISHGARHGWSRLRWLVDIKYLLVEKHLDLKRTLLMARIYHYHRSAGQGIYLAKSLFNLELVPEMERLTKAPSAKKLAQQAVFYFENRINLHSDPVPEDVANYHKSHLFALRSMQQKIIFIISFLYPYPEDKQLLPLPKAFHFLYFPLRPFLWVWRKTRKHALS